ncbi:MAG: gliding motility-associated C-terminal domain-containing protein [Bacteroidota bacterium]
MIGADNVTDNSNNDEDDHDPFTVMVEQTFDLALTKVLVDKGTPYVPGDTVTFRIYVYNQGSVDATMVFLEDYVPQGLTLADSNWTVPIGTYTFQDGIAAGMVDSIDINLRINSDFTGTSITNNAEITDGRTDLNLDDSDSTPGDNFNDTPDPNDNNIDLTDGSDDYDPATVLVQQPFDLALTIVRAVGQDSIVNPGEEVETKITVFNQGIIAADSIAITATIPAGTALSTNNPSDWTQINDSTVVIFLTGTNLSSGQIASGAMHMIPLFLVVDENNMAASLTVRAEISGDGSNVDGDSTPDSNPNNDNFGGNDVTNNANGDEDDHDPVTFALNQTFDLALTKRLATGQLSGVSPGDTVNYAVTVFNQGSLDAYDVDVVDYIPTDMTLIPANGWANISANTAGRTVDFVGARDSVVTIISLKINDNFAGNSLTNTAEIAEAAMVDNGPPVNDSDSDFDDDPTNDGVAVNNALDGQGGDQDDSDFETINVGIFDLSLNKSLAAGQSVEVNLGDIVEYQITVRNEGIFDALNVEVIDHIPNGMILSATDTNGWVSTGPNEATITIPGPIVPNDSTVVNIRLQLIFGNPNSSINNIAEVSGAFDDQGNFIRDQDSETGDDAEEEEEFEEFEDDEDAQAIFLPDYEPIGYIYCEKTGQRLMGGQIILTSAPAGGSIFFAVDGTTGDTLDGRTGYYQFFTNGVPGQYTITYSHPEGFPISTNVLPQAGAFDPSFNDGNPAFDVDGDGTNGVVTLGSDIDTVTQQLLDGSPSANPYYLSFDLEPGDPFLNLNNIPVSCVFIGAIVCEDQGGDGSLDGGVDGGLSGMTVHLYECADTLQIISSTTTDNSGNYRFDGLEAGCYRVQFVTPNNYYIPVDNGIISPTGWSGEITLNFGECDTVTTTCFTPCPTPTTIPQVANICQGDTVQLTASVSVPNVTYSWTPTTGLNDPFVANPVASPLVTTTYVVEIDPSNGGCMIHDTVRVNVFNSSSADFHATTACVGDETVFTDKTTPDANIATWMWDFGDGIGTSTQQNPTYTYTSTGRYMVKLLVETTNGCRDSIWQEVMVSPSVFAQAKARRDTICAGECVELLAQGGTQFAWSPAATLNHTDCFNPIACPTQTTTYYVDVTNDFGCTARDSVTITVLPGPTVDVAMTDISECGLFDGTITVTANGPVSNYQYSIDGGLTYSSNNTFTNLPASSYLVVVRGGGCEVPYANNPVVVGGAQAPAITAVPTVNPSCEADDGTITIEASGAVGLIYSINGGITWESNNVFTDLPGGTFYIAVASADRSCLTYYPPVTLVKPVAPVFTDVRFTNPSDCDANDGTLTVIATGDEAIEYGLDNGIVTIWQSSNNFINLAGGIYDVYIRNAGNTCVTPYALNSIELAVPATPSFTTVAVSQPTDCDVNDGEIDIVATAGSSNLEYSIDGGINWENTGLFENLAPGVYNAFIRNEGGNCEIAYSNNPINVNYPESAQITEVRHSDPTDCGATDGRIEITAEGGAADLIYSVNGGTTWQESSIFANLSGGIYNVRVANVGESCPVLYPTIELVDPVGGTIDEVTVNGGCESGESSITIAATSDAPLEFSIDGGSTYQASNNFLNLPDGDYNIIIRNVNNQCAVVYVNNPVEIRTVTATIDNVLAADPTTCGSEDGSISVNATGANLAYSIDGGINFQTSPNFDDLPAGIYNIFIKDVDTGCEAAYIFNPLELVGPEAPTVASVEVTNPSDCNANDAVITIVANGDGGLQYSLDGSTWSNGNSFINLLPGLYNVWVRNDDGSCEAAYENNPVVINAPTGPIITDCIGTNPSDCNTDDGRLTVLATGGQGRLQYSIDGGANWQTSNEFTNLAAGVYSIAVANEDLTCRAIHPICELTAPEPPVVNDILAVDPMDCGVDNGSITILADGEGGLEYSLDDGRTWSANSFFDNLAAGTYDVRVRNAANNCEVDAGPVTLNAPTAPTIVSGVENVSTCTGSFVPVSITISEDIEQYTILGSGGYLNAIVNGSTITFDAYLNGVVSNFNVTLENEDGCSVVEEFAIFQAADPEADFIVNNPSCAAIDVIVEFTGEASPAATLTWDLDGATIVSSSPASATAPAGATLTVQWPTPGGKTIRLDINDGGCTDRKTQSINVNKLPFANAGADVTICDGECVQLEGQGNGSIYQWTPAIGLSATDIPNPTACPPTTTTYQLLVMGADGCMVTDEVTVTVSGELTANAGADQSICDGESVQLNATGGVAYTWSPSTGLGNPNIANPIAQPTTITTYTVTVTNAAGCVGTDEVVITVNPKAEISAGEDRMICVGENAMLAATGGVTYTWSPATGLNNANIANPIANPTTTTTYTVTGTDANGCTDTDEVTVVVGGNAQANAGPDVTVCSGATTTLNASGGVTYSWAPTFGLSNATIANPELTPIATTTYTVTVVNADGCVGTDEVTVTVNGGIAANAGADQTICNGESANLNATGGTSYTWSPAASLNNPNIANPVATPTVTTIYTVAATNAQGCTATDQVTVLVNGNIVANAGIDQTICNGASANLNATGGTSYTWSPSTGLNNANIANPVANPTVTTLYTVTVTNAQGCTATDQVTVFVNGNVVANAGTDQTTCVGTAVNLNATGGTSYTWSPATGLNNANIANPIANPTTTTTYCVTVSNGQGCTSQDCVTITINGNCDSDNDGLTDAQEDTNGNGIVDLGESDPNDPCDPFGVTANAGADQTICSGSTASLNATGGTFYTWSPSIGLNNANIANPIANPTTTTTYTVTVRDARGCTDTDQVTVFVNGNLNVNVSPNTTICTGNSTVLSATGGTSYTWSPSTGLSNANIANPVANPTQTTTYCVTVSNGFGCTGTACVTVNVTDGPTVVGCPDKYICGNGSVRLTVNGGASWVWSPSTGLDNPNSPAPVANPTQTTVYTVTGTDINGCSASDQVVVFVNEGATANAGPDQTTCGGGFVQLNATGGNVYTWSPATGLNNANIANPVANPTVTTTYTVTASNGQGCTSTDQVTVFVGQGNEVVGCEDKTICPGGSVQLTVTTGASYLYTPATGLSDPTSPTPIANPTQTTTYTVFVTDANGCTGSDQITVFVDGNTVANAGSDQTVCAGSNVQLNASGGVSYSWSPTFGLSNPNIANPTLVPIATTTYTITVTTANGCTDTDQVTVFVNNSGQANAGPDVAICNGESTQLNATGGNFYSWSPTTGLNNANIANPIAAPTTTTTYTVTATSVGGCVKTDQVTVTVRNTPIVTPTIVNPGCCGDDGQISLNVTGGSGDYTYQWAPSVAFGSSANNLAAGAYKVVITDRMGCDVVADITLTQNCGTCTPIATEREVCVAPGATVGELCLPIKLENISNYLITAAGQTIVPDHGCNFENLTAYSYSLLTGAGNDGPYKIDNWTVNGNNFTGMVNNMTELTAWMNSVDPSGNWTLNSPVLIIMGGNPTTAYGDLKLTHQRTWVETVLNPNTTGVSSSTLVNVPMGNADNVIVSIRNLQTCCEETVLMQRCYDQTPPPVCTEEIVTIQQTTVTINDCNDRGRVCVDIPLQDVLNYDITVDGVDYSAGFTGCDFDTSYAYTYFTMPDQGANGPYRLRSWTIDGVSYSTTFSTLSQLVTSMNIWDPEGNWQLDTETLTLQGGMPSKNYGTMDVEQVNTGGFAILELNSNLVPVGTELSFSVGTKSVLVRNRLTNCIDQFTVTVTCQSVRTECDDFIANSAETYSVIDCNATVPFCVEIPVNDLGIYSIEHNGSIYTGDIEKCDEDGSAIQLHAGVGKNIFTFTNELTECSDQIVIKVNCLQSGDAKTPIVNGGVKPTVTTTAPTVSQVNAPSKPIADDMEVVTMMNNASTINVLATSRTAKATTDVTILEQPQHGKLEVHSDNTVTYQPEEDYCEPKQADYFRYEVCNGQGCDEAKVTVIVDCAPLNIFTGLSPNRDGINDYFTIEGLEAYPDNELKIVNRFGKVLYQQQNYQNDWDGSVDGDILPNGTYFYILNDGKGQQYTGFVELNR